MSEYQYYEFLAVNRPLTRKQIDEVRQFSTRAEITSTSFVNEYHFGSFKGNPDLLVTKYFDLMLYYANWGTHRVLVGLPAEGIDLRVWKIYENSGIVDIRSSGDRVLVDFNSNTEDYDDFEEGGSEMASLAPIRSELLGGDLRPLYLGWLSGLYDEDSAEAAPPTPPGLDDLTPAQTALASFLRVDDDLLEAAARRSQPAVPPKLPLKQWIEELPLEEKNQLLFDAASGEGARVGTRLMQRYSLSQSPGASTVAAPSVRELLEYARAIREKREAEEQLAAAAKRRREDAAKAAAREKQLTEIAARQDQIWRQVEQLVGMKNSKAYDSAIGDLLNLRDVALRQNALAAFANRVRALRETHSAKSSFIQKLNTAQLEKT